MGTVIYLALTEARRECSRHQNVYKHSDLENREALNNIGLDLEPLSSSAHQTSRERSANGGLGSERRRCSSCRLFKAPRLLGRVNTCIFNPLADYRESNVPRMNLLQMTQPRGERWEKKHTHPSAGREKKEGGGDRRGMITTCKHSDSGGRANERARTGIESERARAAFQNIHSHTGQRTFGCVLSGAGGVGGRRGAILNAWDPGKEFDGAWEWRCHGSRQRTLLKKRRRRKKAPPQQMLGNTVAPAQSQLLLFL